MFDRDREARGPAPAEAVLTLALLVAALVAGCDPEAAPPDGREQPQRLPTATVRVGDVPLLVEVADEEDERQRGMMFRRTLGPDEAMLFVFEAEANLQFWMKNTYVDLDIAFIAGDGTILQIERLKAHVLDSVYSREPARFALELPAGWFASHGIGVGKKVAVPPEVAAPREHPTAP